MNSTRHRRVLLGGEFAAIRQLAASVSSALASAAFRLILPFVARSTEWTTYVREARNQHLPFGYNFRTKMLISAHFLPLLVAILRIWDCT